jgi:peroxiredoxin
MAEMPSVGDVAPEIRLQGIGGRTWSLADQRGRGHVVLLFYVLDWTPG